MNIWVSFLKKDWNCKSNSWQLNWLVWKAIRWWLNSLTGSDYRVSRVAWAQIWPDMLLAVLTCCQGPLPCIKIINLKGLQEKKFHNIYFYPCRNDKKERIYFTYPPTEGDSHRRYYLYFHTRVQTFEYFNKKKLGKYITKCLENMQPHSYLIFPIKHTFPLV